MANKTTTGSVTVVRNNGLTVRFEVAGEGLLAILVAEKLQEMVQSPLYNLEAGNVVVVTSNGAHTVTTLDRALCAL